MSVVRKFGLEYGSFFSENIKINVFGLADMGRGLTPSNNGSSLVGIGRGFIQTNNQSYPSFDSYQAPAPLPSPALAPSPSSPSDSQPAEGKYKLSQETSSRHADKQRAAALPNSGQKH